MTGTEHCTMTLATQVTIHLSYWFSSFYTGSHHNTHEINHAAYTDDSEADTSDCCPKITGDSQALPPLHNSSLKAHQLAS